MRRSLVLLLSLAWSIVPLAGTAGAGELRQIVLTDGSVLTGEVLSYQNGIYTVRTEALGTVAINDARVRSISTPDASSSAAPPASASRSLQEQMQSDEQVMEMIRSLKDDPAFRKVLEDPELMRAVEAGDLATLIADPRFLQLLENSKVLEIQKKMTN